MASSISMRSASLAVALALLALALALAGGAAASMSSRRPTGGGTAAASPHHHQRRRPVANATYAVGLSATGFLLPFVQGAVEALTELGVVQPSTTPIAGSSGGALLAFAACSGAPPDAVQAALEALAERCRPRACTFTQDAAVREAVGSIMDAGVAADVVAAQAEEEEDAQGVEAGARAAEPAAKPAAAAIARRCRGKAYAAISVAFGRRELLRELRGCLREDAEGPGGRSTQPSMALLLPRPAACALRALHAWWWRPALWVVGDDWIDADDLADGVAASCFFPVLSSASRPWAALRGRGRLLDGVFASPLPLPPLPGVVVGGDEVAAPAARNARPVRVSAVPLGTSAAPLSAPIAEAEIAPFLRVKGEGIDGLPSPEAWRRYLVLVPSAEERAAMRELGRREAVAWWSDEVVLGAEEEEGGRMRTSAGGGGGLALAAS